MKRFLTSLFGTPKRLVRKDNRPKARLRVESLEERYLMSVAPDLGVGDPAGHVETIPLEAATPGSIGQPVSSVATDPTPTEWVEHNDPGGFSVKHPQGWGVQSGPDGRITLQGTADEQLVIWPFSVPGTVEAPVVRKILLGLAKNLRPGFVWSEPQDVGGVAVRVEGRADGQLAVASVTWVSSSRGSAGNFFLASAPEGGFRQLQKTFAAILQSFHVVGTQAASPTVVPDVQYERWQDPNEGAFNLEVPKGWQTRGGEFRFSATDVRPSLQVTSPDGKITLFSGDADIPMFTQPDAILDSAGFTEGTWYDGTFVYRYDPGVYFAKDWVTLRLAKLGATEVQFKEARDLPEVARASNEMNRQYGLDTWTDVGDVSFTAHLEGRDVAGYVLASTSITGYASSTPMWEMDRLLGFLAPPERVAEAQAIGLHVFGSLQENPQWRQMQEQTTMNVVRIQSQTNEYISKLSSDSYWYRQSVKDGTMEGKSKQILEVEDTVDPTTGGTYRVQSGANYYWIDNHGNILGTDTNARPSLDYRDLVVVA